MIRTLAASAPAVFDSVGEKIVALGDKIEILGPWDDKEQQGKINRERNGKKEVK